MVWSVSSADKHLLAVVAESTGVCEAICVMTSCHLVSDLAGVVSDAERP